MAVESEIGTGRVHNRRGRARDEGRLFGGGANCHPLGETGSGWGLGRTMGERRLGRGERVNGNR